MKKALILKMSKLSLKGIKGFVQGHMDRVHIKSVHLFYSIMLRLYFG